MTAPDLTAEQVLDWLENTTAGWRALITEHPELLGVPCDVAGTTTVGGLMQHIVAVELRYSERLAGLPISEYANIPFDSPEALFAVHDRAATLIRQQLDAQVDWDERIEFMTRSMGKARSSRRTILFHAMLHSIRHYAQLATVARHAGVKPAFAMDYMVMDMERL